METGILWDMDGVLVDTGEAHYISWVLALGERDLTLSRQQFEATFGMNNIGTLRWLLGEEIGEREIVEIGERKEELFREAMKGRVKLLPGVQEWLRRLRGWAAKQAIATSAPPANIDVLLDEVGVRSYFDAIVSGSDMPGKPDPAVFLEAARQIGLQPENCVVIEDSVAGVEAARRAGIKCIAVTTTTPADALQSADIIVGRLDELPEDAFHI